MKIKLLFLTVFLSFAHYSALAETSLTFSINSEAWRQLGNTAYILKTNEVMSRLEFPLDTYLAGLDFNIEINKNNKTDWKIGVGVYTNLIHPENLMKDNDWLNLNTLYTTLPLEYPWAEFSYTESDAELVSISAKLLLNKLIFSWEIFNFYINAGYEFQNYTFDIIGFTGWQSDLLQTNPATYYNVTGSGNVLDYKVIYHMPMAGGSININLLSSLSFDITANYILVFASDVDDHILRCKLSTAHGLGHGFNPNISAKYQFKRIFKNFAPFVSIYTDLVILSVTTDQKQEWYEGATEAEPGTVYTGIYHQIISTQVAAGIKAGFSF